MNKPIREPCQKCAKYKDCALERRGSCTDFKRKEVKMCAIPQKQT